MLLTDVCYHSTIFDSIVHAVEAGGALALQCASARQCLCIHPARPRKPSRFTDSPASYVHIGRYWQHCRRVHSLHKWTREKPKGDSTSCEPKCQHSCWQLRGTRCTEMPESTQHPSPFTMRGHEKAQGWSTSCKSHDTCWQLGEYPVLRRWSPCRITHVTAVCLSVLDLRRIACAAEAWDCQGFKCSLCCAPRTQSSRHGVANVIAGGAVPCITASYTSDR